jgi:hypothetical protein
VGLNPGVLRMVQNSGLAGILGREAMHFNLEVAITKYLTMSAASSGGGDDSGRELHAADAKRKTEK